jgi:hypothetical protein
VVVDVGLRGTREAQGTGSESTGDDGGESKLLDVLHDVHPFISNVFEPWL